MYYLFLIGFYFLSYYFLMFIFNYSTYHKYFKFTFPILISYGLFIAFLFLKFGFYASFITYLVIFSFQLFFGYRKQIKSKNKVNGLYGDSSAIELSFEKTLRYYILSSMVYLLSFAISFIYIFNEYYIL